MKQEFILSERICMRQGIQIERAYDIEDVKEFIKRLKERFDVNYKQVWGINQIKEIINKLAGDKLI